MNTLSKTELLEQKRLAVLADLEQWAKTHKILNPGDCLELKIKIVVSKTVKVEIVDERTTRYGERLERDLTTDELKEIAGLFSRYGMPKVITRLLVHRHNKPQAADAITEVLPRGIRMTTTIAATLNRALKNRNVPYRFERTEATTFDGNYRGSYRFFRLAEPE
ncbi:MAG TPA: hypothetical protein VJC05_00295 [Candidatus Andersenbacteria bacterium]|nr:hypothetical protein [Candidatus Andersenbacteria bacterium]